MSAQAPGFLIIEVHRLLEVLFEMALFALAYISVTCCHECGEV